MEFPPDAAISRDFAEALRGMVDREFLASQNYQQQQWRANREGANPFLLEFERRFIKRMAKLGVPMFCPEMIRDGDRQNDLYAQGVTKARAGQSSHNYGLGMELIHSVKGWGLDSRQWQLVGHMGHEVAKTLSVPFEWGGDDPDVNDSFNWDPAHWELGVWKTWKDQYPWL